MLLNSASTQATMPKIAMIRTKRRTPIPAARMAVISLSAARRLRPMRMPTSTPMGMVTVSAAGSVRKKSSATLGTGALLRTTNSSIRLTSRMKITNVNTAIPIRPWERTSFSM